MEQEGLHFSWLTLPRSLKNIFWEKVKAGRCQGRNVNVREEGLTSQQRTTFCLLSPLNIVYLYVQAPRTWNHEVRRPEEWGWGQSFLQSQGTHRPLAIWWQSSLSKAREAKVTGNFLQSPCPWSWDLWNSWRLKFPRIPQSLRNLSLLLGKQRVPTEL